MYYLIVLVLLFLAELFYFRIADKCNIIDKPNERSSHTRITLRGGGIIFYFGVLAIEQFFVMVADDVVHLTSIYLCFHAHEHKETLATTSVFRNGRPR